MSQVQKSRMPPLIPFISMSSAYDFCSFLTLVFLYLIPSIDLHVLFIFAFFKTVYLCHYFVQNSVAYLLLFFFKDASEISKFAPSNVVVCMPSNSYVRPRILSYACPQIHTCALEYCRMHALKFIRVLSNIVVCVPLHL